MSDEDNKVSVHEHVARLEQLSVVDEPEVGSVETPRMEQERAPVVAAAAAGPLGREEKSAPRQLQLNLLYILIVPRFQLNC